MTTLQKLTARTTGWLERKHKPIIVMLFIGMFLAGVAMFKDYGISWDEDIQRYHSEIAAKKYADLFGITINHDLPDINDYQHKYYGTAIQMPAIFIEYIFRKTITSESRNVFLIRHFWTFSVFFVSLVSFYFLLLFLFKSRVLSVTGILMLFLYPRYLAHAFYNIKDSMFASLLIIALSFSVLFLQKKRHPAYTALAGFFIAFAINSRFYVLMLLGLVFALMLFEDCIIFFDKGNPLGHITLKKERLFHLISYPLLIAAALLTFIVITPASWSSPFEFIYQYVNVFAGYTSERWNGSVLFQGEFQGMNNMSRLYFPVWLGISVPLYYLVCMLTGAAFLANRILRCRDFLRSIFENRYMLLIAGLFFVPFAATILKRGLVYDGWRHLLFTFPLLVVLAVYGISALRTTLHSKIYSVLFALVCAGLVFQGAWIVKNHPYENIYFNHIGRKYAAQFDRDYWGLCTYQLLQNIMKMFPAEEITYFPLWTHNGAHNMLEESARSRVEVVDSIEKADYIITTLRWTTGSDAVIEGFREIDSIWVDGYKIGATLKRIQPSEP